MQLFVYEFLFRGAASVEDNAWHVILAREVTNISGDKVLELTNPLTPLAAASLGYDLSKILGEVSARVLVSHGRVVEERDNALNKLAGLIESPPAEAAPIAVVAPAPKKSTLGKLTFGLFK